MGGDEDSFTKLKQWIIKFKESIHKLDAKKTLSKFNIKPTAGSKKTTMKVVNSKRFMATGGALVVVVIAIAYMIFANNAFGVVVNGVEIAKVKDKRSADSALETLKQGFEKENDAVVAFKSQISYEKIKASKKQLLEGKALEAELKKHIGYSIRSAVIYADDKPVASFKTKDEADRVLKDIEEYFLQGLDRSGVKEISFAEKVEVKEEFSDTLDLMTREDGKNFIIKGTSEIRIHKVESGESFWSISRKYDISIEDLQKANPSANPEKIKIGQEINLVVPKSLIRVKTVEDSTYTDKIPYEQKLELSSSLYKDQSQVRVKGQYGEKEIKAEITKVNGIETGRVILSEKIIKQPKDQILVKGTKDPPPKKGTGTFSTPTRGSITSRFGRRWGRLHEGIDIAAPVGTAVKAADGGEVIFAGTSGTYGKLIKVDHGGGFVTYYGHLSKINVKVGAKVYKGQNIGSVGNTGRSTGPHLHFEIRKNGSPVNPSKYL
ncbi:MAG: M23 family metallopeptidase [Lutispora sp.]|nr:M23 family metallopeptidase [Lutispora sp.]MDD4834546.1 M23 family metallopeptidase [Lutispora sp.]